MSCSFIGGSSLRGQVLPRAFNRCYSSTGQSCETWGHIVRSSQCFPSNCGTQLIWLDEVSLHHRQFRTYNNCGSLICLSRGHTINLPCALGRSWVVHFVTIRNPFNRLERYAHAIVDLIGPEFFDAGTRPSPLSDVDLAPAISDPDIDPPSFSASRQPLGPERAHHGSPLLRCAKATTASVP
jgi:hypothetical protein